MLILIICIQLICIRLVKYNLKSYQVFTVNFYVTEHLTISTWVQFKALPLKPGFQDCVEHFEIATLPPFRPMAELLVECRLECEQASYQNVP